MSSTYSTRNHSWISHFPNIFMYVVNLQQQKPPQWKQPLSQRIRLYVVNLQHQKPQWKQQLSPTYLPVWPQSKQPLSHHTQLYVVNLQHYSTRKHLRYSDSMIEAPIFPACTPVCCQPTAPESTPNIAKVRVEAPIFLIFPPYSTVHCQPTAQKSTSAAITASYSTQKPH